MPDRMVKGWKCMGFKVHTVAVASVGSLSFLTGASGPTAEI